MYEDLCDHGNDYECAECIKADDDAIRQCAESPEGHDIVSYSFANEETGQDQMHCSKCPWEFHHIYY